MSGEEASPILPQSSKLGQKTRARDLFLPNVGAYKNLARSNDHMHDFDVLDTFWK